MEECVVVRGEREAAKIAGGTHEPRREAGARGVGHDEPRDRRVRTATNKQRRRHVVLHVVRVADGAAARRPGTAPRRAGLPV